MDFVGKLYKPWKPLKIRRKVRITKLCKVLKPAAKIFKLFKPLLRMLFPPAQPRQPLRDEDLAFMTCVIKVDASKAGWQKAVLSVLRNCRGTRFKMDQNGAVEVSGIADPNKLLKKLGRSRRVELQWFQFGQCSSNLFMPPPETKKNPPPPPPPPLQEKQPNYNTNNYPLPNPYNNSSFPPPYTYRMEYGYNYQPPQLLPPYYAPYQTSHRY